MEIIFPVPGKTREQNDELLRRLNAAASGEHVDITTRFDDPAGPITITLFSPESDPEALRRVCLAVGHA